MQYILSFYILYIRSYLMLISLISLISPYIPLNPSLHFVPAPRTRLRTLVFPLSSSYLFFFPFPNSSFRPFPPSLFLYLPLCVILSATIGGCCESRGSSRFSFSPPRLERGPLQHLPPPPPPLLAISTLPPLSPEIIIGRSSASCIAMNILTSLG